MRREGRVGIEDAPPIPFILRPTAAAVYHRGDDSNTCDVLHEWKV